jgi:hypothetical protein
MALHAPAGFRFVWGGHATALWHLYPADGRRSTYGEPTGQSLCGAWPHYAINVGYSIWRHEAAEMPLDGVFCRSCAAQLRGRALVTPPAEQARLF